MPKWIRPMPKWIAATSFDCVDARGRRFRAVARIGEPVVIPPSKSGLNDAYARCPISLSPLVPERGIGGHDTFQALALAFVFLRTALKVFALSGGRVFFPGTKAHINLDEPSFCPWPEMAELRTGRRPLPKTKGSKEKQRPKRR
jgi:hypothetical protein